MGLYQYPQNDFDRPGALLSLLGSFWATTYQGNTLVEELASVAGQAAQQTYLQLLELVRSVSRFDVPIFHQDNWYAVTIKESELNTDPSLIARYTTPASYSYTTPAQIAYGVTPAQPFFAIPRPEGLVEVKAIFNQITAPSVQLVLNIDFWLNDGVIVFRENPFNNPKIAKRDILNALGEIVDRELVLWLYRGQWDWNTIYEQFGYALRLKLASSAGYKQFINAIFDAFNTGTTVKTQQLALAAIFGVPLVLEATETVEYIGRDRDKLQIITDSHAYAFPRTATAIVSVGDTVHAGEPLTDLMQVFELNRGESISPDDVSALTVGPGVLAWGFYGDITFDNNETPVIVELDVNGYTKVSWALGGFPTDVDKFWDDVHAAGVAKGQTLAMLLDQRPAPVGQPTAAALPATIVPMTFLTANLLRNNAFVVKVKPGSQLSDQLAFVPVEQLRKIQPPQTLMLLIVELAHTDAPVIMENPGTAQAPGYEESLSGFACMVIAEEMPADDYVSEQVRVSNIGGRCI